jgi:poly-gamma-glutamate synthesis protein (capsule biosynthesis protein)
VSCDERRIHPLRPRALTAATAVALAASLALGAAPAAHGEPMPSASATLIFSGDVLMHTPLWDQAARNARRTAGGSTGGAAGRNSGSLAFDFRPMFDDIRGLVSRADLAVCHLETPIAPRGQSLSTFPLFGVPREVVPALADAGFDRCSTASNHALDRGSAGVDATVGELLANGMSQAGTARSAEEILPRVIDVNGLRISHLSYTFSYNGLSTPPGEPWRSALIDTKRIIRDARAARATGAEAVIVSLHWGTETRTEPNSFQVDVAQRLAQSPAIDLIIGHHAHVVQPIANVNGKWVAYGLSNLVSNLPTDERWPANSQDGLLVEVTLTRDPGGVSVSRPRAYATWVDKDAGFVVRLAAQAARDANLSQRANAGARESLARTGAVVGEFLVSP